MRLVLACAFVFAAFAQSVHSRELEHAVCSDHGELIHVGAFGHDHGQPLTVAGQTDGHTGEEEHEHCAMVVASRETLPVEASLTPATTAPPLARTIDRHCTPIVGVATYRIAPKNSPPLA